MTLLVGWIAVDQRSAASAYIVSDSQYTWARNTSYTYGRKVFAFTCSPDIIAYCGDILFPSMAIARTITIADKGLLFSKESTSAQRSEVIFEHLERHFLCYPTIYLGEPIDIYHISRDIDGTFHTYHYHVDKHREWKTRELPVPSKDASSIVFSAGSGFKGFQIMYQKYNSENSLNRNTSRNIFHCFCDGLLSKHFINCGGAPQLVGLYRVAKNASESIKNGIDFGIILKSKRYFLGAELDGLSNYDIIRWFNDLFEICDGNTMLRKDTAMPQPNPFLPPATP
ncbi:MAG TPA: hypothetical protein PKU80_06675 [Candidatus Limiplasma sp.]|nr:hypothetical protein [Candidatus Limiplasma sp.]HRX08364.1 hypothetical protein [Candidatus Limiplasma sp.]